MYIYISPSPASLIFLNFNFFPHFMGIRIKILVQWPYLQRPAKLRSKQMRSLLIVLLSLGFSHWLTTPSAVKQVTSQLLTTASRNQKNSLPCVFWYRFPQLPVYFGIEIPCSLRECTGKELFMKLAVVFTNNALIGHLDRIDFNNQQVTPLNDGRFRNVWSLEVCLHRNPPTRTCLMYQMSAQL